MPHLLPTVLALLATDVVLTVDHLTPFRRSVARYQLAGILPSTLDDASFGDASFVFDCEAVGATRCEELRLLADTEGRIDLGRTRDLWSRLYPTTRAERKDSEVIPATLDEFKALHPYASWPREVVEESAVKRAKRIIYRGHASDGRMLSVSETEDSGGVIREVEIALAAADGRGDFQFYVYDASGALAAQSEFPGGMRPAPEVCVNCHANARTLRVDRFLRR